MSPTTTAPKGQNKFALTFVLCALAAACIYLPFYIIDKGFFLYAGDFNSQQINFYYAVNHALETGSANFSWYTDLGSGLANSFSFYLLGSPFFWLASIFPAAWQPYLMVPLLCLKFGTAGGGAFLWARRYVKDENWAVVAGALYALSGFTVYNVFFNHFVDVVALFPYLLWALDSAVQEDRCGFFAFFVALNLINNYFFFVGQVVFLCIYVVCQCLAGHYPLTRARFGRLTLESLLGCCMGCVLVFPAVLSLAQNPRTVDFSSGFGLLIYGKAQQYFAILASLFLPPDPPFLPAIFTEGVIKWTSLTAYLPLVGVSAALPWLHSHKGSAFRRILLVCLVCAFVPVLNSAFYALNSSYYARWYYMPVLVLCVVSAQSLETSTPSELTKSIKVTAIVTLCFAVFGLVPTKVDDVWQVGTANSASQLWLGLILAVFGLALFWVVCSSWRGAKLPRIMLAAVLGFGCVYSLLHVGIGKFSQWDNDKNYVQQCYVDARALSLPEDGHFYRIDAYNCYDNIGLWTDKSCIQYFGSTVAPSILEFYPSIGITRDVRSKIDLSEYAVRGLLGVRYLLCPTEKQVDFEDENAQGWTLVDGTQPGYLIYENENWLPMGLTFSYYIQQTDFENIPENERANILCKALVLPDEQVATLGGLLQPLPQEAKNARTYADYTQDVEALRAHAATDFVADGDGFTATIQLENENFVLFSVPYDDGFTATVNGQETEVLKVDSGLMAVRCPAGACDIRFTFRTRGLAPACAVTGVGWVVFAGYLLWCYKRRPKATVAPNGKTIYRRENI